MFDAHRKSYGNRPKYDGSFAHRRLDLQSGCVGCLTPVRVRPFGPALACVTVSLTARF